MQLRLATTLVAAVPLLAGACRTTHTERFAPPPHARIEEGFAARTWEVLDGSERIGRIVEFQAHERVEDPMFVVQNSWSQDLGMIDGLGRAWRFRPHQREAEWVATGTVVDGAAAILEVAACTLVEVPLERAREAAVTR